MARPRLYGILLLGIFYYLGQGTDQYNFLDHKNQGIDRTHMGHPWVLHSLKDHMDLNTN